MNAKMKMPLIKVFRNSFSKLLFCLLLVLCSCCRDNCTIEPAICYTPPQRLIGKLPSPFPPLTKEERGQDWGRELFLGRQFAREMDLYRALTCFKSAQFLIPKLNMERLLEIEYEIFFAYYLANKYQDAVEAFEASHLISAPETFPALHDLLITLYDAYIKTDQPERAYRILGLLGESDLETANNLILGTAITDVDVPTIMRAAECSPQSDNIYQFVNDYTTQSKSVSKAKWLNAVLPGAGYFYVGQKKAALTSFIINALFIAATYQLFDRGYIPAAIITGSLEMGWYFGGINGAGLSAREYNERLYECLGKEMLIQNRLFPILMIQMGF